jgi:hypothetical protein
VLVALALAALAPGRPASAQPPGFGGFGGGPAVPARDAAPVDLTGTWVSLVTEDWIERMSPDSPASGTPGGFGFGRGGGGGQAPVTSDDACAAYGAGGIMRVPGRVRISWDDDETLLLEYDAGSQRRIVYFADDAPVGGASLQGHSTASWEGAATGGRGGQRGFGGRAGNAAADEPRWDSLEIVTTDLTPGYLLTSRSWYGPDARLTELVRYHEDFGQPYFTVTAVIEENGQTTSVTSSTFRKESNDSRFERTACTITPR